ncbi:MAG: hypothetical protein NC203_04415 [Firmicutes bacterium]|nr:hypothetical protein [Bacillota bacterium]
MSQEELLAKLFEQLMESEKDGESKTEEAASGDPDSIFGDIDIEGIMKLGEIMSSMSKSDKNTQLLLALKPHLRPENRQKADNAIKLLKILNILPLLKESGIIDGLF